MRRYIILHQHFPLLFEYLASQPDISLTAYKLDTGKEDKKNTIEAREKQAEANLDQRGGLVQLAPEVWQYMVPGSGPAAKLVEEGPLKIVCRCVQILRYEQGFLNTTLAEANYGESNMMDHYHTLLLKDLSDLQVFTKVTILEQVANMVHQKTTRQLPASVWETLCWFQFREGTLLTPRCFK